MFIPYTKTIAAPFGRAAVLTADAVVLGLRTATADSVRLYRALTSEKAIALYQTAWLIAQLAFWLLVLAGQYTVVAIRACRRYYQAEWASDIQRLIRQVWLRQEAPACAAMPMAIAPAATEEVASDPLAALAIVEPPATATAEVAPSGMADQPDAASESVLEQGQAIIAASSSPTVALRRLARLHDLPLKDDTTGKYRRNADLRKALMPLVAVKL